MRFSPLDLRANPFVKNFLGRLFRRDVLLLSNLLNSLPSAAVFWDVEMNSKALCSRKLDVEPRL